MSYRSIGSDMRAMMAATNFALRNLCLFSLLFLSLLSLFCSLVIDQFNLTFQPIIMPLSLEGLSLFALMRHGLRMKLKLQRQREENWKDDGARITLELIILYTPNTVVW